MARIDDQRTGRALLARLGSLPELERAALELVDLAGLTPREAAAALRISRGALRVRLFRARNRLRRRGTLMSTFEDRLWSELVREHADRMRLDGTTTVRRGRRPAVLTGTALGATGGGRRRRAARVRRDEEHARLRGDDALGRNGHGDPQRRSAAITALNAELTGDGIAAKAIPLTADCPVRGFEPHAGGNEPKHLHDHDRPAGTSQPATRRWWRSARTGPGRSCWPRRVPLTRAGCFDSIPTVLHSIDPAHVPPALKAAIHRARAARAKP